MTRFHLVGVALLASVAALAGCRAEQLGVDQLGLSATVRNLQENQVLDNLILAQNQRHFVQINYSDFIGKVTQGATVSMPGSHSTVRPLQFVSDIFNPSFGASNTADLGVTGKTITDKVEVYQAYFSYLKEHELLIGKPEDPDVHVGRWYEGKFYYVPKSQARDFQQLTSVTTNTPGSVYKPADPAEATGEALRAELVNGSSNPVQVLLTLKETPPFPVGALELVIGDSVAHFNVRAVGLNSKGKKVDPEKPSDLIVVEDDARMTLKGIPADDLTKKTFTDHRPLHLLRKPVLQAEGFVVRIDANTHPPDPLRLLLTLKDPPPFKVDKVDVLIGKDPVVHSFKAWSAAVTSEGKKVGDNDPSDLVYVEDSGQILEHLAPEDLAKTFMDHRSMQLFAKNDPAGRPMLIDPAKIRKPVPLNNKYPDLTPPTPGHRDTEDISNILDRIRLQSDFRSFDELHAP